MKLEDQKEIQSLFSSLKLDLIEMVILIPQNETLINIFGKIEKVDNRNLIINVAKPTFDLEFLKKQKTSLRTWFIDGFFRYSFEFKINKIQKLSTGQYTLETSMPKFLESRRTRRFIRVKNNLSQAQPFPHIVDISMSGIGIRVSQDYQDFQENHNLQLVIDLPYFLENQSFYQTQTIKTQVIRQTIETESTKIIGAEFQGLSKFEQAKIYQYILTRKNELLQNPTQILPPIILKSLQTI